MKKLVLFLTLLNGTMMFSQAGAMIVNDPSNALKITNLGNTMIAVKKNSDKIIKALNTIEEIKYYSNITTLLSVFEDSYCILQDLDVNIDLDTEGLFTAGCTHKFKYKFNLMKIEKSVKSITMAITSKLMTISEREKTITDAINNFQKANKELAKMSKEIENHLSEKKERKKFQEDIITVFNQLDD